MDKFEGLFRDITKGEQNTDLIFSEISLKVFGYKEIEDLIFGLTYIDADTLTIDMDFESPALADSRIFNYIVENEHNFQNAGFGIKHFKTADKNGVILSWTGNKVS